MSLRRAVHGERGSVTVLAAAAVAVLLTLTVLGIELGAATLTRHRAAAAADLAALAAAGQAVFGSEPACRRAGWVADRDGGRLTACRVSGWVAEVSVTVRPPGWLAVIGTASAHARAGPAEVSSG